MKLCFVSLVSVFVLGGCTAVPQPPEKALVAYGHELDQLFADQRGCTVCRFDDMGDFRYYVIGPTGISQMLPPTTHVTDTTTTTVGAEAAEVAMQAGVAAEVGAMAEAVHTIKLEHGAL